MGIVRNSIRVRGLADEKNLPSGNDGQIIMYSKVETLTIPTYKPEAKDIQEVGIELNVDSERVVACPDHRILVLGGLTKYMVSYTENSAEATVCHANIQMPYNTFLELSEDIEGAVEVNTFIVDAYFYLAEPRSIYVHLVYLIHVLRGVENEDCVSDRETNLADLLSEETSSGYYDLDEEIL